MIGSLGLPEMILLFVLALIIFGPRRLPEIGRTLGKAMGEFRKASNQFRDTLEREVAAVETTTTAPAVSPAAPASPNATLETPAANSILAERR